MSSDLQAQASRIALLTAVLLCIMGPPHSVQAQPCPLPQGAHPILADQSNEDRLEFIRSELSREHERVRIWSRGWSIGLGLLAGGQAALVPIMPADLDMRPDLLVGAGSSVIGLASLIILPPAILSDQPALEGRLANASLPAERCAVLAEAEKILLRDAGNEQDATGWLMHSASAALALGSGLLLGLVWDHWQGGAIQTGASLIIGEAMLLTQPTELEDALSRYRRGELKSRRPEPGLAFNVSPLLTRSGGGFLLVGRF